jgi:TPR repeat protein
MNKHLRQLFLSIIFSAGIIHGFAQISYPFLDDKTSLYGFRNEKGKVKIKPRFQAVCRYWSSDVYGVKLDGKWGFLNRDGDLAIPYQYDFADGLIVTKDGKKGMIDSTGKQVVPMEYTTLAYSFPFLLASRDNSKFGFIDYTGNVVIPFVYDTCRAFDNEILIFKNQEGGYDYKNPTRLAAVKLNGSWGFINKNNQFIIPPIYKDVQNFTMNWVWVSVDGRKYGGLSRSNRLVAPFEYTEVGTWDNTGTSSARFGYTSGSVNTKGIFRADRMQPRVIHTYTENSAAAEEMIKNGFKALDQNYPKEAIQWFTKAYNAGSAEAARLLADRYRRDTTQKNNRAIAYRWYKNGAAMNELVCMSEVAEAYITGKDLPKNDSAAFGILKQLAASLNGYDLVTDIDDMDVDYILAGLTYLADYYQEGTITPKDPEQAFYWYKKAADFYDPYACMRVADALYKGVGTTKDIPASFKYYLQAADEYAEAMYFVGKMYYTGEGTAKDTKLATEWLKLSAGNGYKPAVDFLKEKGLK